MHNSKLFKSLKLFSKGEWRRFEAFLQSPFHNTNQRIIQLFIFLKEEKERLTKGELDKQTCFAVVFPQESFQEQKLFNIVSLLYRKVEEFQAQCVYQERKGEQLIHLMVHQSQQKTWSTMEKTSGKLRKGNWASSLPFAHDFYAYQSGLLQIQSDLETQRHSNGSFYQTIQHLDRFFLSSRLKMACEHLNRSQVVVSDSDPIWNMEALIPEHLKTESLNPEDASLVLYLRIFRMFSGADPTRNYQLSVALLRENTSLSPGDKRDGTAYCINYCIRQINAGGLSFQSELFQLYQWAIAEEVLMENGALGEWHFKNIVRTAIRQQALDWAEAFVEDHVVFLKESVRENAAAFNRAVIHFERKSYSEARKLLIRVRFTDLFYSLDSKVLLCKIYFEQEEEEPLRSMLKSLQIFLRRRGTLSPAQKSIYENFTKTVQALSAFRESWHYGSKEQRRDKQVWLEKQFVTKTNMTQYAWVMEKFAALTRENGRSSEA